VGPAAIALLNLAVTDDDARLALVREGAGAALGAAAQLPAAHGTEVQVQAPPPPPPSFPVLTGQVSSLPSY
jgi:hypothetical protein